jgi:hypothetical protein
MESAYDVMDGIIADIDQIEIDETEEDADEEAINDLREQAFQELADVAGEADNVELP